MSSTSGSPNAEVPAEYDLEGNIPCGTYKLNFGSNFLSNKNDSPYHILKFDIKPPTARGNAYINFDSNDSMKLTIPTDEPENTAIYKGPVSSVKNGKECLLLFDGENLRIEKVATTIVAKHVRCEKGDEDEEMKPTFVEPLMKRTPAAPVTTSTTIPKITTTTTSAIPNEVKVLFDADGDISDGESSDDEEQMLLEQIASSTQPPSNPETLLTEKPNAEQQQKQQQQTQSSLPFYTPSTQSSPARTHSSATYHPSPVSTIIPTPPSKTSSLLEDLMMSDSSDSSESDSDSDNDEQEKSKNTTVAAASIPKPEPMDYTMNEKRPSSIFNSFDKPNDSTNNDIRNLITGGGFDLLNSDLQLSESSSDEDN